jgi:holo-[acyl-carrier protein] synthase
MILGIGIDFVSNQRIKNLLKDNKKEKFLSRIFSKNEIIEYNKKLISNKLGAKNFFAKRYAAKEALSKAVGTGIGRGINFSDIEISNDELGKPQIKLLNNKKEKLKKYFNCKKIFFHLSLTDETPLSGAVVIIESK